jgi:ABC-type multidrug transport system ATPase subunit
VPQPPAIEVESLSVAYAGRPILRDFSLRVRAGEKVTLTGPSGVGKSTVLRCILGLAVPDGGTIRIEGRTLDSQSVWDLRQRMGFVAQEPDLGDGTVRRVLERPFSFRANADRRGNLDRVESLMGQFNLPAELLDAETSGLSGGEKQRVALLSVVLLDRPIVLLDEASSALDPANKQAVVDFFSRAPRMTVLSVSHESEWAAFSNRVVDLQPPKEAP